MSTNTKCPSLNNMEQGIIIKGISGFYYVKTDKALVTCKARGIFRQQKITPVVGDYVRLETAKNGQGQILEVLPRKNELVRPFVANIDLLAIIVSASVPEPDWLLIDKLLIQAQLANISPVLILNKIDESVRQIQLQFADDYNCFPSLQVSAATGQGMEEFYHLIEDKICCLAGQSAVGKTSILNSLLPDADMQTGTVSKKTERGRHTTRVAELLPFRNGAILDTPGFSLFDSEYITQEQLNGCYPEFEAAEPCRFRGCSHINEPDCGVKELLTSGKMSNTRYQRYAIIRNENEERRKHRYD